MTGTEPPPTLLSCPEMELVFPQAGTQHDPGWALAQ